MSSASATKAADDNRVSGRNYAIVEAPSILGLKPTGVEKLATALLDLGLESRLHARRAGAVATLPYEAERDPETLTLNTKALIAFTPALANAVQAVIDHGEFPVVLGGDCSIVLGSMLALRRRGRFGLLFIDGHADFYQPEVNPNGEAASMDLAFVTGHGPKPLVDIENLAPLVRAEDTVAFGFRDADEQAKYGSQPLPPELRAFDLDMVRRIGVEAAAVAAIGHLTRAPLEGFFIHVDADCLDDTIMPAVDYRLAGGLSWDELRTVIQIAVHSGRAVGLELTIYNPSLDRDGSAGRGLVRVLAEALGSSASGSAPR